MISPSRKTQPYRRNRPRTPGPAFSAMRGGRSLYGRNPADGQRRGRRRAKRSKTLARVMR